MHVVRAWASRSHACAAASRDSPVNRARYSVPCACRTVVMLARAGPSTSRAWSRAEALADDASPSFAYAPTCTAQPPDPPLAAECRPIGSADAGATSENPPRGDDSGTSAADAIIR